MPARENGVRFSDGFYIVPIDFATTCARPTTHFELELRLGKREHNGTHQPLDGQLIRGALEKEIQMRTGHFILKRNDDGNVLGK